MRAPLLWLLLLCLALPGRSQTLEGTRAEREAWKKEKQALAKQLSEKVFAVVEFHEATLPECVEWLKKQGVKIEISPEIDANSGLVVDPSPERANVPLERPGTLQQCVTLSVRDVSALEVVRYVTNLANVRYEFKGGRVILRPFDLGCQETYLQIWENVPANFFKDAGDAKLAPPEKPPPQGERNVAKTFQNKGLQFPGWTFALYSPESKKLIVRHHSREVIEQIDDLLAAFTEQEGLDGEKASER